jgi:hypothetical protein
VVESAIAASTETLLDSGIHRESTPTSEQVADFTSISAPAVGFRIPVASQKNGPVAGAKPRFARQHTQVRKKEP